MKGHRSPVRFRRYHRSRRSLEVHPCVHDVCELRSEAEPEAQIAEVEEVRCELPGAQQTLFGCKADAGNEQYALRQSSVDLLRGRLKVLMLPGQGSTDNNVVALGSVEGRTP